MGKIFWAAGFIFAVVSLGADSPSPVTFNKDVLPILEKNCQSCHRPGQIAPLPLLTYENEIVRGRQPDGA